MLCLHILLHFSIFMLAILYALCIQSTAILQYMILLHILFPLKSHSWRFFSKIRKYPTDKIVEFKPAFAFLSPPVPHSCSEYRTERLCLMLVAFRAFSCVPPTLLSKFSVAIIHSVQKENSACAIVRPMHVVHFVKRRLVTGTCSFLL